MDYPKIDNDIITVEDETVTVTLDLDVRDTDDKLQLMDKIANAIISVIKD